MCALFRLFVYIYDSADEAEAQKKLYLVGICSVLVATGQKTFDFSGDLDVATKIELKYSILGRHRRALLVGTVQIRL